MPARVIPHLDFSFREAIYQTKVQQVGIIAGKNGYTILDTECRRQEMQKEVQARLAFLRKTTSSLPQFSSCGEQGVEQHSTEKGAAPTLTRYAQTSHNRKKQTPLLFNSWSRQFHTNEPHSSRDAVRSEDKPLAKRA